MKRLYLLFICYLLGCFLTTGQEFDLTLTSSETGTKLHQARNSITFGPNYSYTPGGGTMTAEIVNPLVSGDVTYNSLTDPENKTLNTSYMAGSTSGLFNVNALGAATYTIPIDVLPGVAGLQPSLALTYNSLGGPGIAGYGWNISGVSAIARSPQTYSHDGQTVGVDLSATDRFTLDGQRLVCISGSYGANGSVYRTEHDIFSKVTCYTGSNGPERFEVKTKSGLICQYGYTSNSNQNIDGHNQIVSWYINKISDVYGNEMNFTYIKDDGHIYIAEITYGPNTIIYYYKQRSDKTTSFLKGSLLEQKLILETIEVKYNSDVVKKYEIKYNYPSSNYTSYSVLNEMIEYGTGSSRLNSTVFSYLTPDNVSFVQTVYNQTHDYVSYKSVLVTGDYNGDGKADFLCLPIPEHSSWTGLKVYNGNGNDNFNLNFSSTISINLTSLQDILALDLNGDGRDDVLYETISGSTSTFYYLINNGTSFLGPYTIRSITAGSSITGLSGKKRRSINKQENDNEMMGADYNGNGVNDVFINDINGNWWIYSRASQTGQLGSMLLRSSGTIAGLNGQVLSADFNGDGKVDIWSFDANGVKIYTYTGSTLNLLASSSWPSKDHHFAIGDFNGDGKVDVFVYGLNSYDWQQWQVGLSNGTGFTGKFVPQKKSILKDDYVRLGDFNGDGCTDLMVSSSDQSWTGTFFYISINEGSDFYTNSLPSYPTASHRYHVADFNGDGRTDFLCNDGATPFWNGYQMYRAGTKSKMLLEKVGNGLNHLTKISYKYLSEPGSHYTKESNAVFPVLDFQGPLPVVSSVLSDNGRGTQNTTSYTWQGVKIHRQGKGFLCYAKQMVTDVANNMSAETNCSYNLTKFFPQVNSTVHKAGSTTLSTVNNTWNYNTPVTGVIFPYISSSTQTNSLTGHSITQSFSYDSYGNPSQIVKSFNNGVTETITNGYDNNTTNWWLGRLLSSTTNHVKSGETTLTSIISFTYSSDGILKPDFIKYYEGTPQYYYKNHDYNSNGNLIQLYEYGTDVGARQTNYTYETNGIRLKTVTDPLGHETEMFYDSYGRLSSEEDYLGNITSFTYDNLSRTATETLSDGFVTTTTYNWGLTGGPAYACFNVQQSGNDGSVTKTWYDELAREIRTDVKGFDGANIYTTTEYNTKGQVHKISEPEGSTTPSQLNVHSYDTYGRISEITRPSGRNTTFSYSSNRVTETTGGKSKWKETDSQGLITKAHDNGGDIVYAYYPDGKIKTITAPPGGYITSMEYSDAARNQTKLIDPSAGTIEYTYNSFGQIKTQKNARNQTITYNYHADGRINSKVTSEGTTSYTYNTNKQLTGISSPESVSRSFGYDNKGRVNNISETIPGSSTFSTTFTYDSKGRLSTRTHPAGIVETNNYNTHGYLASIAAGGATRFTITEMDARQQIKEATYGTSLNGSWDYDDYGYPTYTKAQVSGTYRQDYRYSFDPVTGNLNSRQNYLYSKSESFTYDNLDRLKTVSGPQNLTMNYTASGNITSKSDLGTNTFEYNHPTKPYALTTLSTTGNLVPEPPQYATYTSFEQVRSIGEGEHYASFTYNADDQRCKMEVEDSYGLILTRWYVGSRYMKETAGASTKEYTWIGGDAYTAPVVAVKIGSTTNWYYALRDYLGTITHLVWSTNNVAGEYTFDAWGRRRDKDDWSYNLVAEPELFAGRGFTGHEWLPWFNLYNMNGRLYDPAVGRFLSPDNYVQDPLNSQNYNRYSYVLNNPLKYTDPDGESFLLALATVIVGNYVIGWLDNVINKGMSPKEAFKNTNFIMGVDFNPGDMSKQNNYGFSNPQVNAHNEPKKEQERTKQVNKKLDDVKKAYGQAWQEASGGNDSFMGGGWHPPMAFYNIVKAVNWMDNNAHDSWKDAHGQCAYYVRMALEAGGINTSNHPVPARLYGSYLESWGFSIENSISYFKGDIAVIQGYPGATSGIDGIPYGHIQMYNGSIWISDFKQHRPFWPSAKYEYYEPPFIIYRWSY